MPWKVLVSLFVTACNASRLNSRNSFISSTVFAMKKYTLDSGAPAFTTVLTTPVPLRSLFLLDNRHYLKVRTDATWKDLSSHWCVMPFSLLPKKYDSCRQAGGRLPCWCTHFREVFLTVSSSECHQAHAIVFQVFSELHLQYQPPLQAGPNVRQVHGDWATSIESARRSVVRNPSAHGTNYVHMWLNMKGRLAHLPDKKCQELKEARQCSRTHRATLAEFHHFWPLYFCMMETSIAGRLGATATSVPTSEHVVFQLPPDVARTQCELTDPV